MLSKSRVDELVKLFSDEFSTEFPVLADIGFMYAGIKINPATNVVGKRYVVHFIRESDLAVEISFWPCENDDGKEEGVFTVYIKKLYNGDFFEIGDWYTLRYGSFNDTSCKMSSYQGTDKEKINGFKNYLSTLLSEHNMQLILKGQAWENVPFDWGGYK